MSLAERLKRLDSRPIPSLSDKKELPAASVPPMSEGKSKSAKPSFAEVAAKPSAPPPLAPATRVHPKKPTSTAAAPSPAAGFLSPSKVTATSVSSSVLASSAGSVSSNPRETRSASSLKRNAPTPEIRDEEFSAPHPERKRVRSTPPRNAPASVASSSSSYTPSLPSAPVPSVATSSASPSPSTKPSSASSRTSAKAFGVAVPTNLADIPRHSHVSFTPVEGTDRRSYWILSAYQVEGDSLIVTAVDGNRTWAVRGSLGSFRNASVQYEGKSKKVFEDYVLHGLRKPGSEVVEKVERGRAPSAKTYVLVELSTSTVDDTPLPAGTIQLRILHKRDAMTFVLAEFPLQECHGDQGYRLRKELFYILSREITAEKASVKKYKTNYYELKKAEEEFKKTAEEFTKLKREAEEDLLNRFLYILNTKKQKTKELAAENDRLRAENQELKRQLERRGNEDELDLTAQSAVSAVGAAEAPSSPVHDDADAFVDLLDDEDIYSHPADSHAASASAAAGAGSASSFAVPLSFDMHTGPFRAAVASASASASANSQTSVNSSPHAIEPTRAGTRTAALAPHPITALRAGSAVRSGKAEAKDQSEPVTRRVTRSVSRDSAASASSSVHEDRTPELPEVTKASAPSVMLRKRIVQAERVGPSLRKIATPPAVAPSRRHSDVAVVDDVSIEAGLLGID